MKLLILATLVAILIPCTHATSTEETQERILNAKMDLWARGSFSFGNENWLQDTHLADALEAQARMAPIRLGPVKEARRSTLKEYHLTNNNPWWNQFRGGGEDETATFKRLGAQFGPEFLAAIEEIKREHAEDCQASCEMFYCAQPGYEVPSMDAILNDKTRITSYSMGAVPPEDFAAEFGFPLDLIKVTEGVPLFSAEEAANVIKIAEGEGVDKNEYKSGKYQLGGDWLINLPSTRKWFNERLESTFFPLLASLFPEVISSPSVLRAHSVSLLKYNASHPRTDVHIDNGILAMTLAMTPQSQYTGGGTFFEHMGPDNILPMDVGHGTFRPGSVRHGGHRVSSGTRYVLGAFLLIEDRPEFVRRLKNKGSEFRSANNLEMAAKYFEWALALNPSCTTCLKDWGEVLHAQKRYPEAEEKIRKALTLLENKDSDALFTLGVLLSAQGRDDESIEAYQQSVKLNAEDAELCYNLGIKLGAKGKVKEEMEMYAMTVQVDLRFGGAWLNWGTALAETGNLDDAEPKFLQAVGCGGEIAPKAMLNLGLLYHARANSLAQAGKLDEAKKFGQKAADFVDAAKPLLEHLKSSGAAGEDIDRYIGQLKPLRLQCHRIIGQLLAAEKNFEACEAEFRKATESFPHEIGAWQMLGRVLELQGKTEEVTKISETVRALSRL